LALDEDLDIDPENLLWTITPNVPLRIFLTRNSPANFFHRTNFLPEYFNQDNSAKCLARHFTVCSLASWGHK